MGSQTSIEWTQATWNPVTGCTKISPGCRNCYAERMALRLQAMGNPSYTNGFDLTLHERMIDRPLSWNPPKKIFVNSMSDLFHANVPLSFIESVFEVMRRAPNHQFQMLTKRSERLLELNGSLHWAENVWMGVSVEDCEHTWRIDHLRNTGACCKFLSIEPLLGPLPDLDLSGIDWVIAGGESGPGARPMSREWIADVRDQCLNANVPFFFKQWGGTNKKKAGRLLDGRTWDQAPRCGHQ